MHGRRGQPTYLGGQYAQSTPRDSILAKGSKTRPQRMLAMACVQEGRQGLWRDQDWCAIEEGGACAPRFVDVGAWPSAAGSASAAQVRQPRMRQPGAPVLGHERRQRGGPCREGTNRQGSPRRTHEGQGSPSSEGRISWALPFGRSGRESHPDSNSNQRCGVGSSAGYIWSRSLKHSTSHYMEACGVTNG